LLVVVWLLHVSGESVPACWAGDGNGGRAHLELAVVVVTGWAVARRLKRSWVSKPCCLLEREREREREREKERKK
jgi:hypothetical protein